MEWSRNADEAHAPLEARGAKCGECPLRGARRGPIQSEIKPGALALVIGQEPSKFEINEGKNFVGPVGRQIDQALESVDANRHDHISIANVIACQCPPQLGIERFLKKCQEEGKPSPIECCAPRLQRDIEESSAPVLITLGSYAMEAVAKKYKIPVGGKKERADSLHLSTITQQAGHPLPLPDGKVLMPALMPGGMMLQGAKHMLRPTRDNIAMGIRIARRGHIDNTEPQYLLRPTVELIEAWCAKVVSIKAPTMVDIETAGLAAESTIRCIGMGVDRRLPDGTLSESIICVPLFYKNGDPYWSPEDYARVRVATESVLNECPLAFHNAMFDTKVLVHQGWIKDRYKVFDDTMLMHRNSREVECPHKLSFVSTRFGEFLLWKGDVDVKSTDDTDDDLYLYNVKDVRTQMIARRGLKLWLTQDGTWKQYEEDKILARIYRDVGELGWYLDEAQRLRLSKQINERVGILLKKLRKLVFEQWAPASCQAARKADPPQVDAEGNVTHVGHICTGCRWNPKPCKGKIKKDPNHTCDKCSYNPASPPQVARFLFKAKGLMPAVNKKGREWKTDDEITTATPALLALIDHGVDKETFNYLDTHVIYKSADKLRAQYTDSYDLSKPPQKNEKKRPQLKQSEFPGLNHLKISWNLLPDTGRLSSNPNCFHPDTDILTKRGWISVAELGVDDQVAQFDLDRKTIEFVEPLALTRRRYDGFLIQTDWFCVTPDHRLVFELQDGTFFTQRADRPFPVNASLRLKDGALVSVNEVEVQSLEYHGTVYCLSMPYSHVVARYRYEPIIIGQCQNIPNRTALNIKTMYVAPPGHVLIKADFDQIEVRVVAALSNDELDLRAFREGLDVHSLSAAFIYSSIEGKPAEEIYAWLESKEITPEERDLKRGFGKGTRFSKAYGAADDKVYSMLVSGRDKATNVRNLPLLAELPRSEGEKLVRTLCRAWNESHPTQRAYQESLELDFSRKGFIESAVMGRRRYCPDGPNTLNVLYNYPAQSTAADIANRAAKLIDERIPHRGWSPYSGLICQVHDELTVCVPEERAQEAARIIQECMRTEIKGVPITATPEIVKRWSGPICKCGGLLKSHKKKLPKNCSGFEPMDADLDREFKVAA